ncbi:hypothetical protein CFAM422_000429 [Trichoderma lentiforme]|uniref:Uncharacterized protein n=1 Tax=Trichoderma lentiforme TaxID=1567552 RepID=A0A9P4XN31_9HYPO|nr:hypothetical protein CFAM422_000429 [Trichoderma lentiforme]
MKEDEEDEQGENTLHMTGSSAARLGMCKLAIESSSPSQGKGAATRSAAEFLRAGPAPELTARPP